MTIRVFLVDDHEVVRSGLRRLLEMDRGVDVIGEAATVRDALRQLPELAPDVAVLDLRLPDGNGVELCRELRSRVPKLRCIMLTGFADDEALFASILAGASGYLQKQIDGRHLVSAIRRVAAGESLIDLSLTESVRRRLRDGPDKDQRLARLSKQEGRILDLIAEGLTNREISERLYLAEKTVKNYVSNMLGKLGMSHRTQAAAYAARLSERQVARGSRVPRSLENSEAITVTTANDLSGAEKVNEALASGQSSASLLAAIVDSSVDAVLGKTLEGVITSWNLGAEKMYGYEASEVVGHHISLLFPPEGLDELQDALTRIANGGLVEQHDTQRICKDGTVLDVSVTISPIHDASGVIIGAAAIGRDITRRNSLERERRALEARLNQSERLESMGRLAGGIAHDFNNLLAVILNSALFVREELDDQEAARADLDQIEAAAGRASELTRQLLAFARREVLKPQVLDLNLVIVEIEQLLRRTISEQVDFVISLSDELWLVETDPGKLEQVIVNLSVNARDAMPEGGRLTIDTANIEIGDDCTGSHPDLTPGRYVQLMVSDTGSGMERSVIEHIFEPFFTTKPTGKGTGLGLPMVFGIVKQAGGDIQFSSEPGIGTTCAILLPATDRIMTVAPLLSEPRVLRGTETVLVVEDEDALREVTRRILSRNGYAVLTSASGPEAIALLQTHEGPIDLLLTDVIMPQMPGKEAAEAIQKLHPGLPVLYMSGYAQPVLGATLGGDISFLEKPFSETGLLDKVRGCLADSR